MALPIHCGTVFEKEASWRFLKMKRSSRRLLQSSDGIEMKKLRRRAKEKEDTTINLLTNSSDADLTTPSQLSTFQVILNFLTCRWFQNEETLKDEPVGFFKLFRYIKFWIFPLLVWLHEWKAHDNVRIMEFFWCSQGTMKVE
ncbi:Protein CBG26813 [Caenorhabditis briggsae]|uniref:Protein CBG26813 n=1 Tax=Caenorhabditis briggsae TaxID=6238 RepID=B6IIC9_CAEBR|nr:Protein CBG26813 [Caenorhabditis briggsae]CAR99659.1 Protein CBG26813 [Caenorhabditis briggsae]